MKKKGSEGVLPLTADFFDFHDSFYVLKQFIPSEKYTCIILREALVWERKGRKEMLIFVPLDFTVIYLVQKPVE